MADCIESTVAMQPLAVANPRRKTLEGPKFLDQLVRYDSQEKVAIEFIDIKGCRCRMTYRELQLASTKLAKHLQQRLGKFSGENQVIPVVMPQHPALYISYLAILKSGAAFCPITPDIPPERIRFILEDVNARLVLCLPDASQTLQNLSLSVNVLPVDWQALIHNMVEKTSYLASGRQSSDIAYVMYTSGSTGKPKGVPVSHFAVTQSLIAHDEHLPSFKRFLQFAAPTFDVSVFEIFFPWYRGSIMVSSERENLLSDLPHVINTLEADAVELTPTVATTLLRKRSATPGLKLLLTIGEMLTAHVIAEFGGSQTQESILFGMYGPTEASIHCTIFPRMESACSIHDIGYPLSTVSTFVLEENVANQSFRILPFDEKGELAIAGQLAQGYLNRDEQTASSFIELPGYGPVYRTGDKAMISPDGKIQIYGRLQDGQVKLRGQRVELGEVEQAAFQVAEVHFAVAMVINGTIVLFCSGEQSLQVSKVEERCKAWLPRHMRPGDVVILLDGMPRLPSGKVDRKYLQARYESRHEDVCAIGAESNHTVSGLEVFLCKVFSAELKHDIDLQTNLWSSGLNSLQAIRIASKLRSIFRHISISAIMESETVSDLSREITNSQKNDGADAIEVTPLDENSGWQKLIGDVLNQVYELQPSSRIDEVQPCSSIQVAMLSETTHNPLCNMNEILVHFHASATFEIVFNAFEEVAAHNAILRAGFVPTYDSDIPFAQVIFKERNFTEEATMFHPIQITPGATSRTAKFTIHHAVYDGWSWDLIMRDMNCILNRQSIPKRPPFKDFMNEKLSESFDIEEDLSFWMNRFSHVKPVLFPTLISEVLRLSSRPKHTSVLEVTTDVLAEVGQKLHVSNASIVHTAINLLIAQFMDTSEVVSGLVVSGRDPIIPEVERVIGPCLSTLPLLLHLKECHNLQSLMIHMHRQHMLALRHSRPSLSQVLAALGQSPGQALFDIIFVWQESLYSAPDDQDLVSTSSTRDYLQYALVFEVEPKGSLIHLKTTWDPNRMNEAEARVMHDQINCLMNLLVERQDVSIENVWDFLSTPLLSIANPNYERNESSDPCVNIAKKAFEDPDKLAIDFIIDFDPSTKSIVRQSLSYRKLYQKSVAVGRKLLEGYGLVNNDIVAIWTAKSIDLYVLICATVQAGLAYICIDPDTPTKRVEETILNSRAKILFLSPSNTSISQSIPHMVVDAIENVLDCEPVDQKYFPTNSLGSDLAYAVFTSGSTGVPKGVLITRHNLTSNIKHLESVYPHSQSSSLLQSCSPAFDVSVFEIFWTWHCGITLCSARNDILFRDIEGFMNATSVTHLSMTPSVAALVEPKNVPNVEFLVCSGEPMSAKVFEAWKDYGLHQGYGPSETTNICNVRSYFDRQTHINNVGPPFSNTSLFVCSRLEPKQRSYPITLSDFRLLPLGAVGEVWIGGEQVGRGYTNDELTAQSWLDHPMYGRIYRSGDIGRLLADRSLVILGRDDDQAKIRGQRVELNEINSKLLQSQSVMDAFSMILMRESDRSKLVSFWVDADILHGAEKVDILFDHLRNVLPAYMVPESLVPLRSIPLTRQGKVDKRKLAGVHHNLTTDEQARFSEKSLLTNDQGLMTTEEVDVAKVLSDVSGISTSEISTRASFFAYGIDSIRAISFAQKLRSAGYSNVEVSTIMQYSSVKRLVAHLKLQDQKLQPSTQPDLTPNTIPESLKIHIIEHSKKRGVEVEKVLPCTPLQEAMLASSQSGSAGSYTNHLTYFLVQESNAIKSAWLAVVARHDILRTFFAATEDRERPFLQVVQTDAYLPWIECEFVNEVGFMSTIFESPPYSLQLKKRDNFFSELHLFMHHALYDADGLHNIHAEIEAICLGQQLAQPVQFSKYLNFMAMTDVAHSRRFWGQRLENITPCRLTTIVSQRSTIKPDKSSLNGTCSISYNYLLSFVRRNSITLLTLLQTTLAQILSILSDSSDICFGTVFSGRNVGLFDGASTVGPCFNTLPTRLQLRQNTVIPDLFYSLQKFNAEVLPLQATSLRHLQKSYSPDGRPLFDILLLLQSPKSELDPNIWQLVDESGQMDFPFILEVQPCVNNDTLQLTLHNASSDDETFNKTFTNVFENLLEHTTEQSYSLVSEIKANYQGAFRNWTDCHKRSPKHENGHAMSSSTVSPSHEHSTLSIKKAVLDALAALTRRDLSIAGYEKNIFQLGLDSVNAVQLSTRLKSHGYSVSVGDILERPKISQIFRLCDESLGRKPNTLPRSSKLVEFDQKHRNSMCDRFNLHSNDVEAVWPCTATQTGMLSEFIQSRAHLYYNKMRFQLDDSIDLDRLMNSFSSVIALHVMLRTGFAEVEDVASPFCMIVYSSACNIVRSLTSKTANHATRTQDGYDISQPPWEFSFNATVEGRFIEFNILHALYDAHSISKIFQDMATIYSGGMMISPHPVQQTLASIVEANQSAKLDPSFWTSIKSLVQPTKFPDLNIELKVTSQMHVIRHKMKLPMPSIRNLCVRSGFSLSVACQSAWAKVLAAYTGQQVVTFGIILSGRTFEDEKLNEVAFPCINTLPLVVDTSLTANALTDHVSRMNAELHKAPHISLSKIKNYLEMQNQFFDTVVVLQKPSDVDRLQAPWKLVFEEANAEYAVSLEVIPDNEELILQLTYNQKCVPIEHSALLLQQYEMILYQIIGINEQIPEWQPHLIAKQPPKTLCIPSEYRCLHEMVLRRAACTPQTTALEFVTSVEGGRIARNTWSFEGLVSRAAQIANMLLNKGIQRGDLVALCFEKCPEASFALLGILMSGCAYVAIDPGAPDSRREFILRDARCRVILTSTALAANLRYFEDVSIVCLDQEQILASFSTDVPSLQSPPTEDDTCYCLYTSGTTGTPKGCLISHGSAVQAMLSFSRIFKGHWTENSRWLQFAAYHFDVSVLEHFWSWSESVCVTIVPRDLLFEDLPGTINKLDITHLDLTPSLARLLTPDSAPSLRRGVFIVGGEQVGQDIIDTWGDTECLYNFYGPSEVTIGCTVHARVRKNIKPTNIGHQWDNVGTYVLRPNTEESVVVGEMGELCLSGPLVGKGYLNRPELTAQSFITLQETGERVYRTGDYVRMLHDYSFEFLGRIDGQIKLRGQRMEVGEINHVLLQCTRVFADVATCVLKHSGLQKEHLVAFLALNGAQRYEDLSLTLSRDRNLLIEAWKARKGALNRLPGYMVPTYLIVMNHLPLTINNKVNAKALQTFYNTLSVQDLNLAHEIQKSDSTASTEQYDRLVTLISNHIGLGIKQIDSTTSILQLGVDSISAISLSRTLRSAGYQTASVSVLLRRPIISDLFETLSNEANSEALAAESERQAAQARIKSFTSKHRASVEKSLEKLNGHLKDLFPCTPIQEGMLSKLMANNSASPPYLTKFVYSLDSGVSLPKLKDAWIELETRLDILRTRFIPTEDGFAQAVLRESENHCNLDYGDDFVRDNPLETVQECFEKWITAARNLEVVCPWEVWLTQRSRGKIKYMSIFIFHGIYDGVSLHLLLDSLWKLCTDSIQKTSDAVQFQQALPHGPLVSKPDAPQFWRENLPRVKLLGLSRERDSNVIKHHRVQRKLTAKHFHQQCRALSVTPQAILYATWLFILNRVYGVNPVVGIVLSGRSIDIADADRIIGPMFNTLPLAISISRPDASLMTLIQACNKKLVDILPYQHTALSDIRRWLKIKADTELFDSLFVFNGNVKQAETDEKWPWTEVQSEAASEYPLNVEIEEIAHDEYVITIVSSEEPGKLTNPLDILEAFCELLSTIQQALTLSLPTSLAFNTDEDSNLLYHTHPDSNQELVAGECLETPEVKCIRNMLAGLAGVEVSNIGLHHPSLFELGLDSVDALKLSARLKANGLKLPASKILQNPTVSGMGKQVLLLRNQEATRLGSTSNLALEKWSYVLEDHGQSLRNVEFVMPATSMQEALLIDFETYFNVFVYRIDRAVDVDHFMWTIDKIVRDTAILRTSFIMLDRSVDETSFLQTISEPRISGLNPQRLLRFQNIDDLRYRTQEIEKNASVNMIPVLEVAVLNNGDAYFTIAMSHACYDAWSIQKLLDYLQQCYQGNQVSQSSTKELINFVTQSRKVAVSQETTKFWEKHLQAASPTLVKQDLGKCLAILRQTQSTISMSVIVACCRENGITLQSLGLAVWSLTLMYLTRQSGCSFGVVMSGRTSEEVEQLIFPTFNTIIFGQKIDGQVSKRKLMHRIHSSTVEIYEHQNFPLSQALKIASQPGSVLFNTLFTFQKTLQTKNDYQNILHEVDIDNAKISPPYAINVEMQEQDGELLWTIATQPGYMNVDEVDETFKTLDWVLNSLTSGADGKISERDGSRTSICGLPAVELDCGSNIDSPTMNNNSDLKLTGMKDSWTEVEKTIRRTLSQTAGIGEAEISKSTSIFHLGLDSISAIRITKLLRQESIHIPNSVLLKSQTVAEIARKATRNDGLSMGRKEMLSSPQTTSDLLVSIQTLLERAGTAPHIIDCVLPASGGQTYMLDMWKASNGQLFYATFWFEVKHCSTEKFHAAFAKIIAKYPVLRTKFVRNEHQYLQVVMKAESQDIGSLDYQVLKVDDALLVKLQIHHALYDAVSLDLIVRDLETQCEANSDNIDTLTDFEPFLHATKSAMKLDEAQAFWTSYLGTRSDSQPRSGDNLISSRSKVFIECLMATQLLERRLRGHGISLQALFFTVIAWILSKGKAKEAPGMECTANEQWAFIGIYLSNRSLDIDGITALGSPTFNIVPLRVDISQGTNLLQAAMRVQQDLREVSRVEHCGRSLREIHGWTGVKLDCYVNFLKLPSGVGTLPVEDASIKEGSQVRIEHAQGETREKAQTLGSEQGPSPLLIDDESEDMGLAWCVPALDIEAKVDENGELAVGMFAPEDLYESNALRRLVERVKEELVGFSKVA